MGDISLEQVGTENRFNFKYIYEMEDNNDTEANDSPYNNINTGCNYYAADEFQKCEHNTMNYNSYFHINCRSLSKNWTEFKGLINELHGDCFCFEYIGISEVFNCDRDVRLALPGFHNLITRTRNNNDVGRGGVGLFIKDTINYTIREDLSVFIPLFIEVKSSKKSNIIDVIYRPNTPPRADIDIYYIGHTIYDILDIINLESKPCTLMGDFNIDLLKYDIHGKTIMTTLTVFLLKALCHTY